MIEFIQAGGRRLEVETIPGLHAEAPTLIFLHEGLGSIALWRDFPAKIAGATGAGVVTYSRYGHGKSDALTEARVPGYMHREALETLPDLRRELGLDDVVLIGHSDGASIALIHAGAGKWPVRGIILEAPHVFVEDFSVRAITETKRQFETTPLGERMARYHGDPNGVFWGWNNIWLSPDFRDWNIEEYLPGVTCPTLAIQGLDDEYSTMLQIDAIERQIGGPFERLELANCKHSPHRDQEQAVIAAMTRFIGAV